MKAKVPKVIMAEAMALKCGITKTLALSFLTAAFSELKDQIEAGRIVQIRGFGTFTSKTMKGRSYTLQGKDLKTVDHKKISFKPLFKI